MFIIHLQAPLSASSSSSTTKLRKESYNILLHSSTIFHCGSHFILPNMFSHTHIAMVRLRFRDVCSSHWEDIRANLTWMELWFVPHRTPICLHVHVLQIELCIQLVAIISARILEDFLLVSLTHWL